jgi:Sigma-54 interaction domain
MSVECYYSRFMRASPAPSKRAITPVTPLSVLSLPHDRAVDTVDLGLIIFGGSNALLCGPSAVLKAALSALQPHLKAPVQKLLGSEFSLPCVSTGTLILEHVATCSPAQQQALLEWLDAAARHVQVISTTEPRLFELVERGGFSDRLYYRLNTVHLDFQLPT